MVVIGEVITKEITSQALSHLFQTFNTRAPRRHLWDRTAVPQRSKSALFCSGVARGAVEGIASSQKSCLGTDQGPGVRQRWLRPHSPPRRSGGLRGYFPRDPWCPGSFLLDLRKTKSHSLAHRRYLMKVILFVTSPTLFVIESDTLIAYEKGSENSKVT